MCVIAVKLNGVNLNTSDIVAMYEANQQGVGLSYKRLDGKFIIDKFIPKDSRELIDYISKHHEYIYNTKTEVVLHFRIATSGNIDAATCHPYKINNDAVLYHNGVVNNYLTTKELALLDKMSDTQVFTMNHISKFKSYNELWQYAEYNKFAVHHIDGKIELFGAFTTHNNLIVSNTYFVRSYKTYNFNSKVKSVVDSSTYDIDSYMNYIPYLDDKTILYDDYNQTLLFELYTEHRKEYELIKKTGAISSFAEFITTKYSMYGEDLDEILEYINDNK